MPTVSRYPLHPNDEGTAKPLASGRMRPKASGRRGRPRRLPRVRRGGRVRSPGAAVICRGLA